MPIKQIDRLFETTTSTGTGAITFLGAVGGYNAFSLVGNGGKVLYQINDGDANGVVQNWEIGIGTYASGTNQLTRTTILSSSNSNAIVNFGAGTKNVLGTVAAAALLLRNENLNDLNGIGIGGGTANAHTLTMSIAPLAYEDGMEIAWFPTVANAAGATTVNVNSLGSKSLKVNGADLPVNFLQIGRFVRFIYKTSSGWFEAVTNELAAQSRNLNIPLNFAKGASIASAATTDIGAATGNYLHITGTTGITSFGTPPQAGVMRFLEFDGILTITHNASSLVCVGNANITTAVGDKCVMVADSTSKWVMLSYTKANGQALVASSTLQTYESAETTITGNSNATIAHGLGVVPKLGVLYIRCKTAENGFAVGDEVPVGMAGYVGGFNSQLTMNSTNFIISTANIQQVVNRSSFANSNITAASWRYVVRGVY